MVRLLLGKPDTTISASALTGGLQQKMLGLNYGDCILCFRWVGVLQSELQTEQPKSERQERSFRSACNERIG